MIFGKETLWKNQRLNRIAGSTFYDTKYTIFLTIFKIGKQNDLILVIFWVWKASDSADKCYCSTSFGEKLTKIKKIKLKIWKQRSKINIDNQQFFYGQWILNLSKYCY